MSLHKENKRFIYMKGPYGGGDTATVITSDIFSDYIASLNIFNVEI